jgi:hypothetical protein
MDCKTSETRSGARAAIRSNSTLAKVRSSEAAEALGGDIDARGCVAVLKVLFP